MLRLTHDAPDTSPVQTVITVNECMTLFDIHQRKTVHMAILTGRLEARKADSDIGSAGGVYLISLPSAYALWGKRNSSNG